MLDMCKSFGCLNSIQEQGRGGRHINEAKNKLSKNCPDCNVNKINEDLTVEVNILRSSVSSLNSTISNISKELLVEKNEVIGLKQMIVRNNAKCSRVDEEYDKTIQELQSRIDAQNKYIVLLRKAVITDPTYVPSDWELTDNNKTMLDLIQSTNRRLDKQDKKPILSRLASIHTAMTDLLNDFR